jgi:hypothetical protein
MRRRSAYQAESDDSDEKKKKYIDGSIKGRIKLMG